MSLRPTTNLVVPQALKLDKKALKDGFMYVYGKAYAGLIPAFINRLWMSSITPEFVECPKFGSNKHRQYDQWAKQLDKHLHGGYLTIHKISGGRDPHFEAAVPVASFRRSDYQDFYRNNRLWFSGRGSDAPSPGLNRLAEICESDSADLKTYTVTGRRMIANMRRLDGKAKAALAKTLLGLRIQTIGDVAVIFIDFKISKDEAQQLTTTEWLSIRNIDLYPMLLQWVDSQFGFRTDTPLAAFPVSKIARTLPVASPEDYRLNDLGLSIDPKGAPIWLPHQVDNTIRYETLYAEAGDQGGQTFGLLTPEEMHAHLKSGGKHSEPKVKLPHNIPVFIDWVNNKYAYTLSTGLMRVQDLSCYRRAEAPHIQNLLDTKELTKEDIKQIVSVAKHAGVAPVLKYEPRELAYISNDDMMAARRLAVDGGPHIEDAWKIIESYHAGGTDEPLLYRCISSAGDPIYAALGRWMETARAEIVRKLETVHKHLAVSTTSNVLGKITLLTYANRYSEVKAESEGQRRAAIEQEVTPGWVPPPIPLLAPATGMIPHQLKVRNLTKDSPDFALYLVQAGGGKSPLTITDILIEIGNNRSAPYIILCPSHLVANYVKEIVFFTAGQLNVVPINSYSLKRHGYKRLTQMIAEAPRNTVVICDYDTLRLQPEQICYGTTAVTVYPVIEFLRQFRLQYCMLDESHYVKNDSQRSHACMVLITDIPKKRLASGTMAHDSPSDLAIQVGGIDPTLFLSRNEFNSRYGKHVKGDRVVEWKEGAQKLIMDRIMSRVVVAKALRKEWAALLPTAHEQFHKVALSAAQQQVYMSILTTALDAIREAAKSNKRLKSFFAPRVIAVEGESNIDTGNGDAGDDLQGLLGFYLARLEQFINAPSRDPLGDKVLVGADRISPKMAPLIAQMREHLDAKRPGKILIFTNYTASAEEIYNNLPEDLKAGTLLYVAAEKVETGNRFENDPRYHTMVGVENSMNTGLNFQHVSFLMRVETVWNPGQLEQGASRVNRPQLKVTEIRNAIYYAWFVCDRTIDITKISRLISKVIAIAKFENADVPAYETIPDVPIIPMNEECILTLNDWSADLAEYADAYRILKTVQAEDYAKYRELHGVMKMMPLAIAPPPPDCRIMSEVPYIPGLDLYGAATLGLVRCDDFLRLDHSVNDSDADDQIIGDTDVPKKRSDEFRAIVGKHIHTEFGDGLAKSASAASKRVTVALDSGGTVSVALSASYVMRKRSRMGWRNRLLLNQREVLGHDYEATPTLTEIGVGVKTNTRAARKAARIAQQSALNAKRKEAKRLAALKLDLAIEVNNGYLSLVHRYSPSNPEIRSMLMALGFVEAPSYVVANVKTAKSLIQQFKAWKAAGLTPDRYSKKSGVYAALLEFYEMIGDPIKATTALQFSRRHKLPNFFAHEAAATETKTEFRVFPVITDGVPKLVMYKRAQPVTRRAIKYGVKNLKWRTGDLAVVYHGDLKSIAAQIRAVKDAGITVTNLEALRVRINVLRTRKFRDVDKGARTI